MNGSQGAERLVGPAATEAFGAGLVPQLRPGSLVRLVGELGAGKTTLVRGALRAAGWSGPVRSPSFSLVQSYPTDPPMRHADLYRLPDDWERAWWQLGLAEDAELLVQWIEWPGTLGSGETAARLGLAVWTVELTIDPTDASARWVRVVPDGC
ncbi:MAG: tRNA (adenosine(37)-N6)-threonylcarbamoyltransferase complex ATPase subunit type 1 TsaE [Fimbriimonadaceae bacterium]|nr:tRNA (adenosine(37)-N6)-threonylcarbamoyltransferase complex ATPase subunit type 1 TsaE [Fimbriimonadaceae bacterium]